MAFHSKVRENAKQARRLKGSILNLNAVMKRSLTIGFKFYVALLFIFLILFKTSLLLKQNPESSDEVEPRESYEKSSDENSFGKGPGHLEFSGSDTNFDFENIEKAQKRKNKVKTTKCICIVYRPKSWARTK